MSYLRWWFGALTLPAPDNGNNIMYHSMSEEFEGARALNASTEAAIYVSTDTYCKFSRRSTLLRGSLHAFSRSELFGLSVQHEVYDHKVFMIYQYMSADKLQNGSPDVTGIRSRIQVRCLPSLHSVRKKIHKITRSTNERRLLQQLNSDILTYSACCLQFDGPNLLPFYEDKQTMLLYAIQQLLLCGY